MNVRLDDKLSVGHLRAPLIPALNFCTSTIVWAKIYMASELRWPYIIFGLGRVTSQLPLIELGPSTSIGWDPLQPTSRKQSAAKRKAERKETIVRQF